MKSLIKRIICYVFGIVFVLVGWHITAVLLNTPALPTPAQALVVFAKYMPTLWPDICTSFLRVFAGLALGTVIGLPVGLALGRSSGWAGKLFAPVLYLLYPIPKIVLLPILLVLMGLGGAPKIALIALTICFQVAVCMRDAAASVPRAMLLSVRSLGGTRWDEWRHVVLPATLPELFTTLRVSTAVSIAVLFISESFAGSTGLGYFIMQSWSMVNYPRMFAGIIALALLGLLFYLVFDLVERKLRVAK